MSLMEFKPDIYLLLDGCLLFLVLVIYLRLMGLKKMKAFINDQILELNAKLDILEDFSNKTEEQFENRLKELQALGDKLKNSMLDGKDEFKKEILRELTAESQKHIELAMKNISSTSASSDSSISFNARMGSFVNSGNNLEQSTKNNQKDENSEIELEKNSKVTSLNQNTEEEVVSITKNIFPFPEAQLDSGISEQFPVDAPVNFNEFEKIMDSQSKSEKLNAEVKQDQILNSSETILKDQKINKQIDDNMNGNVNQHLNNQITKPKIELQNTWSEAKQCSDSIDEEDSLKLEEADSSCLLNLSQDNLLKSKLKSKVKPEYGDKYSQEADLYVKAVKLFHVGKTVDQIVEELELPRSEVELLTKVSKAV